MTEAGENQLPNTERQSPIYVRSFEDLVGQLSQGPYLSLSPEYLKEINTSNLEDWIQRVEFTPSAGPEIHAGLSKNGRHTFVNSGTSLSSNEGEDPRPAQQLLGLAVLEAKINLLQKTLKDVAPQVTEVGFRVPLAHAKISWAKDEILQGRMLDIDAASQIPDYSPARRAFMGTASAAAMALILAACRTPDGTAIPVTDIPTTPNVPPTAEVVPTQSATATAEYSGPGQGGGLSEADINSPEYKKVYDDAILWKAELVKNGIAAEEYLGLDSYKDAQGQYHVFVRFINLPGNLTPEQVAQGYVDGTFLLPPRSADQGKALFAPPEKGGSVTFDGKTSQITQLDASGHRTHVLNEVGHWVAVPRQMDQTELAAIGQTSGVEFEGTFKGDTTPRKIQVTTDIPGLTFSETTDDRLFMELASNVGIAIANIDEEKTQVLGVDTTGAPVRVEFRTIEEGLAAEKSGKPDVFMRQQGLDGTVESGYMLALQYTAADGTKVYTFYMSTKNLDAIKKVGNLWYGMPAYTLMILKANDPEYLQQLIAAGFQGQLLNDLDHTVTSLGGKDEAKWHAIHGSYNGVDF